MKLTIRDLLSKESDGQGFGLYGHTIRKASYWWQSASPYQVIQLIDETVIEIANSLEFDHFELFEFMNSRIGRFCGDELTMRNSPTDAEIKMIIKKSMLNFKEYLAAQGSS